MLFVVNFDGTIAVEDSVDQLLGRFADPQWQAVEQAWTDGGITGMECMRRQVRMVRADSRSLRSPAWTLSKPSRR